MKQLLLYTNPNKKFTNEDATLAKIQIDNSFDLGYKKEDLLIFTDFAFKYNGVESQIVPDGLYYDFDLNASKTKVLVYLLKNRLLPNKELYWCHDIDAYELNKIEEAELGLEGYDLGLNHYFYKPQWQCGSIFLKTSSKDIFELLDTNIQKKLHSSRNEEKNLTSMIKNNAINPKRFKRMNPTYNIMKRYLPIVYKEATKPLKVIHFRPSNKDELMPDTALNMFMYGKNSLKIPLMTPRLIKIFNYHGLK